jgi:hypothetical protein
MKETYPFNRQADPRNHQVYDAYLGRLGLASAHDLGLRHRGLNYGQIRLGQYATKASNKHHATCTALGHIKKFYTLEGVPGFFEDPTTGNWEQTKVSGLLIPVRDIDGKISSLQVRNDNPQKGRDGRPKNKYLAFSSPDKPRGARAYHSTHCPILKGKPKEVCGEAVRITEGVLKADIATAYGDVYCIGMIGLRPASDLATVLEGLEVETVRIALDAGEDQNVDMLKCKVELIRLVRKLGHHLAVEVWEPEYGKGIDDVLVAGHQNKIREATEEEIEAILSSVEQRPIYPVSGGGLSDEVTKAEDALIGAGHPIYQRGAELVTPVLKKVEATQGRQTEVAIIHSITKARLNDFICQSSRWIKTDRATGGTMEVNPPKHIAETLMERFGNWKFPELVGVLAAPTLRPDGTVLDSIGYDPITRFYLAASPTMPMFSENPTKEDALNALGIIQSLLDEFPFANEASKSVALSAIMSPILRGAYSVMPMHVVRAPMPGSGKSYLMDIVAAIALGHPCPVISSRKNDEAELEKRIDAAILSAQQIVSIDNFNGDLGSDSLCQYIERPRIHVRVLGESRQVEVESRSCLYATGNNIRLVGDLTRRVVQCTLDANNERPELRTFTMSPVEAVLRDRGKYIAAILVIARAYIVAGSPERLPPLASFEGWSNLVRSALVWLGRDDPLTSMKEIRAEDPMRQQATELFSTIWDCFNEQRFSAKQLVKAVTLGEQRDIVELSPKQEALREALVCAVGDRRGVFSTREVGKWLGRHKGVIYGGVRLSGMSDSHGHAATWWLEKSDSADESGCLSKP